MTEIRGTHVLAGFVMAFGTIIAVNMVLAVQAVRTFPGVEVQNSYVASQSFDRDRAAQVALGWDVRATLEGDILALTVRDHGQSIAPVIEEAVFGRATTVQFDQHPAFRFDGERLTAPVIAGDGNWNLRLRARAADGTLFQQRIVVEHRS